MNSWSKTAEAEKSGAGFPTNGVRAFCDYIRRSSSSVFTSLSRVRDRIDTTFITLQNYAFATTERIPRFDVPREPRRGRTSSPIACGRHITRVSFTTPHRRARSTRSSSIASSFRAWRSICSPPPSLLRDLDVESSPSIDRAIALDVDVDVRACVRASHIHHVTPRTSCSSSLVLWA